MSLRIQPTRYSAEIEALPGSRSCTFWRPRSPISSRTRAMRRCLAARHRGRLRGPAQFSRLCPASSTFMRKNLAAANPHGGSERETRKTPRRRTRRRW